MYQVPGIESLLQGVHYLELFLLQARVEHLLMQNKELLSHLQKLMAQLAQIQTLQQSLSTAAATTTTTKTAPTAQTTPMSDTTTTTTKSPSDQQPLLDGGEGRAGSSSPQTEDSIVQPLTSTPTLSPGHAHNNNNDELAAPPPPSDMSLGLDFHLAVSSPATNEPFLPQASETT